MLANSQALNAIVATADAQRPAETDLFSPRSTAAMALSSLSSNCFAGPPAKESAVQQEEDQQRQQQQQQQRPPAALFQSHAEIAPTCKNHSKEPILPSAESRKPQQKASAGRPSREFRKERAPSAARQPKAPTVKSAMKKRSSDSISSNSSGGSLRSVSMQVPPQVQPSQQQQQLHQQYAGMVPVQYVPTAAYTVHHPDFFPPGASTAIPWTPHSSSADGGQTGGTTLYPRGQYHSRRGPSPPSAHQRMPTPPTSHQHGPSPPLRSTSGKGRPSPRVIMAHQQHHYPGPSPTGTTSGGILHHPHHHSGPSPPGILHRPSPPLGGSPPMFGMTLHRHRSHHHHYHHGNGYSVTWQYPPPQPKYYYAATPSAPHTKTSASSAQAAPPLTAAAEEAAAPVSNEDKSTFLSTVTPTSHKKKKTTTAAVAEEVTSSGGSSDSKKKQGQPGYERKKKSLGLLAETFVSEFPPAPACLTGDEFVVDELATKLDVERRRIYDVVNILESLRLVVKRGKNTYHWMGKEHLDRQFALLQDEAIEMWPEAALQNGLTTERLEARSEDTDNKSESNKSLTRLSQLFIQVFLVGYDTVNLPQASDIIQGFVSTTDNLAELGCRRGQAVPEDPIQLQAAAARGLKTKIRRLYDIANVFLSVGLLVRIEPVKSDAATRRPHYQWNYPDSVHDIRTKVWPTLTEAQKRDQDPFDEAQTRAMLKIGLNPKQYVYVPQHQQLSSNNSNNSFLGKDSKMKAKRKADDLHLSKSLLSSSTRANAAEKPSAKKIKTDKEHPPASPDQQKSARRVSFPTSGEGKQQV